MRVNPVYDGITSILKREVTFYQNGYVIGLEDNDLFYMIYIQLRKFNTLTHSFYEIIYYMSYDVSPNFGRHALNNTSFMFDMHALSLIFVAHCKTILLQTFLKVLE